MSNIDFLVIGAQKSGTSSLHDYLRKIEGFDLPIQKEVQFFSNNKMYLKGIDWYLKTNFSQDMNKLRGEISPQYLYTNESSERISKCFPNIKLVVILRHPIERAISHFKMSKRRGLENRDFEEAFNASYEAHQNKKDIKEDIRYYLHSNYKYQLDNYLKYFEKDKILIMDFNELINNSDTELQKLFNFLNYTDNVTNFNLPKTNTGGTERSKLITRFVNEENLIKKTLKNFIPFNIRQSIMFRIDKINIKKTDSNNIEVDPTQYQWFVAEQQSYLKDTFSKEFHWID